MHLTLRKLLLQHGLKPENTAYKNTADCMLDYPFDAPEKFFTMAGSPADGGWGLLLEKLRQMENLHLQDEYADISYQLNSLKANTIKQPEAIRNFRIHSNILKKRMNEIREIESAKLDQLLFGVEHLGESALLCFKNYLYAANPFELDKSILPLTSRNDWPIQVPVFTRETSSFANAVKSGRRLGVVGGPCLFSAYEVEICFTLNDGRKANYDFTSGVPYNENTEQLFGFDDVLNFVTRFGSDITDIRFLLHKNSLTTQESDSIEYTLRLASVYCCKAYIPLPDMSYQKYFASLLQFITRETVRKNAQEVFRQLAYDQTDLFLNQAQQLLKNYPGVELYLLHERDQTMMRIYMEKREEYLKCFEDNDKQLTDRDLWVNSIRDYITMPALPLYMDDVHDIIEADVLWEVDSGRKCQKLHRSVMTIHSLFFPEPICADGEHSMFYAPLIYKEYLSKSPIAIKEYSI